MRLADYIAERVADAGIEHVFMITGGGSMHLNDAFSRNKKLKCICFHHEQAAAMAADSYYRINNKPVVLNVTTGPGGINTLNGVFGAYTDSCGIIIISGQVKDETYSGNYELPLRQLGDQEVKILDMITPIVKYKKLLNNELQVKDVIDSALYHVQNDRPGPVWIDIPLDIQSKKIDGIKNFVNDNQHNNLTNNTIYNLTKNDDLESMITNILLLLRSSVRPVLFAGSGIRISKQHSNFLELINKLKIPVVTGWNAHDVLPNDNFCYAGRPGIVGDRAGNFTVQNSDLIIILGSRLNIRQTSYNFTNFAKHAVKIMVDVDKAEMEKITLDIQHKYHCNLNKFIPLFLSKLKNYKPTNKHSEFLNWCKERVKKYPTVLDSYKHKLTKLNTYKIVDEIIRSCNENDIVVTANGAACVVSFQVAYIKNGMRLYTNSGSASMGYDIPAAIGAAIANGGKNKIVCIAGDGSIMQNLQELQTIKGLNLPIKIIILNNDGYSSIRQTQQNYFSDNLFGIGPSTGVSMPKFEYIAEGFSMRYVGIKDERDWIAHSNNDRFYGYYFNDNEPTIFEIFCNPDDKFEPKLAAKKLEDGSMLAPSLENMSPFLSDEEMKENILV